MGNKKLNYITITGRSAEEIDESVNGFIENGYVPYGAPYKITECGEDYIFQAVISKKYFINNQNYIQRGLIKNMINDRIRLESCYKEKIDSEIYEYEDEYIFDENGDTETENIKETSNVAKYSDMPLFYMKK